MLDRTARSRMCELVRALSTGNISNYAFEDALPSSPDKAISGVFGHGAWHLYCDTREYKLTKKYALTRAERTMVARWILFLKSEQVYSWPEASFADRLLSCISLGFAGLSTREQWQQYGDLSLAVWLC